MRGYAFILIALFCLTSCGPRQDEKNRDAGGGRGPGGGPPVQVKAGGEVVTQLGEKLSTCSDGPTWDTIRMFYNASSIYGRTQDITIFVGKGQSNCLQVSNQSKIEFVQESGPGAGDWDSNRTGVERYVSKLVLIGRDDFLQNSALVDEVAKGMTMSVDQLKAYLASEPSRDILTLTYVDKAPPAGTSKPKDPKDPEGEKEKQETLGLAPGNVVAAISQGSKLASCDSEGSWGQLGLRYDMNFMFESAPEMTHLLKAGLSNCYKVSNSETVTLALELEETAEGEKIEYVSQDSFFKVTRVEAMYTKDLLSDEFSEVLDAVAKGMFVKKDELIANLKGEGEEAAPEFVTITYLEPSEEIVGGGAKPVNPVKFFGMPDYKDQKVGDCKDKSFSWSNIRIFPNMMETFKEKVESKSFAALVANGEFNCAVIGSEVGFEQQDPADPKKWIALTDHKAIVQSITFRDKANFYDDGGLTYEVSKNHGMSAQEFLDYIGNFKEERVNVMRFEWK